MGFTRAAIGGFFAQYRLYIYGALIVLGAMGLAWSFVAVTKQLDHIYQNGYKAGAADTMNNIKDQIITQKDLVIKEKERQITLQGQITQMTGQYKGLLGKFNAMEAIGPKEVAKYVLKDPAFANCRRPADLADLRNRELRALRDAARPPTTSGKE